jgi:hypothetical protein
MSELIKHSNGAVTLQHNARLTYVGHEATEAIDVTELPHDEQLELLTKPEDVFPNEQDKAYKSQDVPPVQ